MNKASRLPILHITAYRFVPLARGQLSELQLAIGSWASALELKGTILLSPEGINIMLAGVRESIVHFKACLENWPELAGLTYRTCYSRVQPFQRLFVKLKKQIIPLHVCPKTQAAPYLAPETFREWLQTGRDLIALDTRNHYEVALGTFQEAVSLDIRHFRHFPQAAAALPEAFKTRTVITFCTGGIRCEKASAVLRQQGFQDVWQLSGGILNYFARCGHTYYRGSCFVFDERESVEPEAIVQDCSSNVGCTAFPHRDQLM